MLTTYCDVTDDVRVSVAMASASPAGRRMANTTRRRLTRPIKTDILTSVWFVGGSNSAHRFAASAAVGTFN